MAYLFPETIFDALRQERQDFLNNEIEIVDGYMFSQIDTIKKAHKYFNSQYKGSNYEEINGVAYKKTFYNINKWRCTVASKQLDIDTKDFLLEATNMDTEFHVLLAEKELKYWMKKKHWGKILNEVTRKLPIYGSVVLEKTRNGVEVVDLRYLMNEQSAASLDQATYVIRKYLMTPRQLREMAGVWENVDDVIMKHCNFVATSYEDGETFRASAGAPQAEVYARYGEVPLSWFTNSESDQQKYVLARFIVAGVDDFEKNDAGQIVRENGIILRKERIRALPFKEVHYSRTEGRWLGIGVVEDTFEAQRRVNELKNQLARAMEISTIHLFQTASKTPQKNVLTDVDNGEILSGMTSEITPLVNEERNLAAFNLEQQSYEGLADRQTFSSDVLGGEPAPASATATAIINQVQQATTVFDYKREDIALFLDEFIHDLVFPDIEKEINKPHTFKFVGTSEELNKVRRSKAKLIVRREMMQKMVTTGRLMTQEEYLQRVDEVFQQTAASREREWLKVRKDFYRDIEFETNLIITGEKKNVFAQLQNIQGVLNIVSRNPQAIQNPIVRKLLFKMMELTGMHISEIDEVEQELLEAQSTQAQPVNASGLPANNAGGGTGNQKFQPPVREGAALEPVQA